MADNQWILDELGTIMQDRIGYRIEESLEYIAKCLDPTTPSHEVSIRGLMSPLFDLSRAAAEEDVQRIFELRDEVEEVLKGRGYRIDIRTFQEHKLIGSTTGEERAEADPYKVIGIIKGELTVDEARYARGLAKFTAGRGSLFGLDKVAVNISLEPLDGNGNTIRDPRLVNENYEPIETHYRDDFPLRRK